MDSICYQDVKYVVKIESISSKYISSISQSIAYIMNLDDVIKYHASTLNCLLFSILSISSLLTLVHSFGATV